MKILLTGATGYIGGKLLPHLLDSGHEVRALARHPEKIRVTHENFETVAGDVGDFSSVRSALEGVEVAYYLVHSMGGDGSFEEKDKVGAENFGKAAKERGVRRIIYLGGLAHENEKLSPHLRSRIEVGNILRESKVPVVEFRASIIIGSGSLSFEMVRSLVDRLPIMLLPKWVETKAQPIAINDVIFYLLAAATLPSDESKIYEIGCAEKATYGDLIREYAKQKGVRRWLIPVPVLTPTLSSLWLALVTPLYARIGRKLIDSIRCETVVQDAKSALEDFTVRPMNYQTAMALALKAPVETT